MLTLDLDALALKPGDLCLDIGCGEGRHSLAAYWLPDVHAGEDGQREADKHLQQEPELGKEPHHI